MNTSTVPRLQAVPAQPKPKSKPKPAVETRRAIELAIGAAVWRAIRNEIRRAAR